MTLEKLLQSSNIVYLVSVGIAAVATLAAARVNAAKDRELETYRAESTEDCVAQAEAAAAQAEAAEAIKIAETERRARAELQSQVAAAEAR